MNLKLLQRERESCNIVTSSAATVAIIAEAIARSSKSKRAPDSKVCPNSTDILVGSSVTSFTTARAARDCRTQSVGVVNVAPSIHTASSRTDSYTWSLRVFIPPQAGHIPSQGRSEYSYRLKPDRFRHRVAPSIHTASSRADSALSQSRALFVPPASQHPNDTS